MHLNPVNGFSDKVKDFFLRNHFGHIGEWNVFNCFVFFSLAVEKGRIKSRIYLFERENLQDLLR